MQRALQSDSTSAMSSASSMATSSWILDFGAIHHMTVDATSLVDLSTIQPSSSVPLLMGHFCLSHSVVVYTLLPLTSLPSIMFLD